VHDVLLYVSLAVLALALVDVAVMATVVLARLRARRSSSRDRSVDPVLQPVAPPVAALDAALFVVPLAHDPQLVLAALARAGYAATVDPVDERTLLIGCPAGVQHRDRLRVALWREVRRTHVAGNDLGPVRFAGEDGHSPRR
jgi:hypothetical protein